MCCYFLVREQSNKFKRTSFWLSFPSEMIYIKILILPIFSLFQKM